MESDNLVSATWLNDHVNDDTVRIVDASWHLPTTKRNAREEFATGHIPGAVYFDIDECSEDSTLPHMLPSADAFADYVGSLGISEQHHIVVYDTVGIFSAARVWWMFRYFGAKRVSVLNGGFPAWLDIVNTRATGTPNVNPSEPVLATFNARVDADASSLQVADASQVLAAIDQTDAVILDARSPGRFTGVEKEFRPGLRSGHIPGSRNIPFTDLLEDGLLKSDAALRAVFERAELNADSRVLTSCGSGVTAAVLILALERIGMQHIALYDGSWSEWGGLPEMPIETGSDDGRS